MYRSVGAGPGDTMTYRVDLPLPWGRDTEVTIPMQAMMDDAWASVEPNFSKEIFAGVAMISVAVALSSFLAALWVKKG